MKNTKIVQAWEKRSREYKDSIKGVLPKSFPSLANRYLDDWMFKQISFSIKKGKTLEVLDVGCGYGRLAKKILAKYPKVEVRGVDIAEHYVDIFNKDLSPRGKAYVSDAVKTPFKDLKFNHVFIVTTLMYVINKKDQEKTFREIARILKPGGSLVIIERDPVGFGLVTLGGIVDLIRGRKHKEIQAVSFSPQQMTELIQKTGFKVKEKKGIPFFTILLPLLFLFNKINKKVLKRIIKIVGRMDRRFSSLLTPSLYISYTCFKKQT